MEKSAIPVYKVTLPIEGSECVLNITGDWHYGVRGVDKKDIIESLNSVSEKHKGNVFRVYTGDLTENALQQSVGHNYDIAVPDPAEQKKAVVEILTETNKKLYGSKWQKLDTASTLDSRAIAVEGNHEYRTRKLTGQWLGEEMCSPAKVNWLGMSAIIELNIVNKRLKMSKTYRLFVAHRPNKSSATSVESITRSFRKKQSCIPGVDVIVFGHFHKRFISANGYFDTTTNSFRKVLYVINPSPASGLEYAEEAGYPPLEVGTYVNVYLPIEKNKQPYGIV